MKTLTTVFLLTFLSIPTYASTQKPFQIETGGKCVDTINWQHVPHVAHLGSADYDTSLYPYAPMGWHDIKHLYKPGCPQVDVVDGGVNVKGIKEATKLIIVNGVAVLK